MRFSYERGAPVGNSAEDSRRTMMSSRALEESQRYVDKVESQHVQVDKVGSQHT